MTFRQNRVRETEVGDGGVGVPVEKNKPAVEKNPREMVKGGEATARDGERWRDDGERWRDDGERKELGAALRERRVGWVLTAN